MGSIEVLFLALFPQQQEIADMLHVNRKGNRKVQSCRISLDEGMLGPMGVECRSRRALQGTCQIPVGVQCGLYSPKLLLDKAIGPGEMWGGGGVVYMVVLQELGELIRGKQRTIVSVNQDRQSIQGDELLQALT